MQWTEKQLGSAIHSLYQEYAPHMMRLRVRRMLLEMADDAKATPDTGTHVPAPYDKSKLILKTLIGDAQDVVQNYTSRVSVNEPQPSVIPVSLERAKVGKAVTQNAAEQERLLTSQWDAVNGRAGQRQVSYSQSWGRVGWYLTLPRDASFGLPDRKYYTTLTDDEIENMDVVPDGKGFKESGTSWMERRRHASAEKATQDGRALFTLDAYPPDMVYARFHRDGSAGRKVKYGFVQEEIPYSDLEPGSDLARSAARAAIRSGEDVSDADIDKYGLYTDSNGKIAGGITRGGEELSNRSTSFWILTKFVTMDEIYYLVSETAGSQDQRIIYHDTHSGGACPLIPVPGMITDSGTPGGEFASLMESVFALTPIINQLETFLTNVAAWNAFGRFVIEDPSGQITSDENGDPLVMSAEGMIGLDPEDVSVVKGTIRQLTIDASMLFSLLEFYTQRLDQSKPAPVTEGQAGASAAAWQVRQLLASSGELLEQAVSNHAAAVKQVMLLWVRWMRMLDEPIYAFAAPGNRKKNDIRGLIEFDPKDLVETITVDQSPQSAQERVVLRQAGVEMLQAGRIDEYEFYEKYDLAPDPEESVIRAWVQRATDVVMLGGSDQIGPDSMMMDVVTAARGQLDMWLVERVPAFALTMAENMAQSTAEQAALGNVAEASGVRQVGLGMGQEQAGSPLTQAPGQ